MKGNQWGVTGNSLFAWSAILSYFISGIISVSSAKSESYLHRLQCIEYCGTPENNWGGWPGGGVSRTAKKDIAALINFRVISKRHGYKMLYHLCADAIVKFQPSF